MKTALRHAGLQILGGLREGDNTVYLLGPDGADFWRIFQTSPEFSDGEPDPIDRYSARVLAAIAADTNAEALFPFGGPPYLPFFQWALESKRCFASPAVLLVHAELGLFASFRGALRLKGKHPLPPALPNPCITCATKPCLSACPAGAIEKENYNVAACHVFLDSEAGADCMARGCAVRRACPVGQALRPEGQSAFHMRYFHKGAPDETTNPDTPRQI